MQPAWRDKSSCTSVRAFTHNKPLLVYMPIKSSQQLKLFTQFDSILILHGSFTNSYTRLFMFLGRKWRWILYLQRVKPDKKGFNNCCYNSDFTIPLSLSSLSGAKHLSSLFQTLKDQCQIRSRIKLQTGQSGQIPRSEVLLSKEKPMKTSIRTFSYMIRTLSMFNIAPNFYNLILAC